MLTIRFSLGASLVLATALLSGCVGRIVTTIPSDLQAPQEVAHPRALPTCKGQKNTKSYASLTGTLSTKGGVVCVPEFGGFGGTIEYPTVNRSVQFKLISSTTDYAKLPQLGPGTAIFYLQVSLSGTTTFETKSRAGAELWSEKLTAGKCFEVATEGKISGNPFGPAAVYVKAIKGKYGGAIGDFGKVRKSLTVDSGSNAFIEIYGNATLCKN